MITLLLSFALAQQTVEIDRQGLEALCGEGDQTACLQLGLELANGLERDEARARELLEPFCNDDNPDACGALATTLPPAERDSKVVLLEHACGEQDVRACAELGKHLARAGDVKSATKYLGMACDSQFAHACGYLAAVYIDSGAGAIELKQVRALQDACKRGDGFSCDYLEQAAAACESQADARKCELTAVIKTAHRLK